MFTECRKCPQFAIHCSRSHRILFFTLSSLTRFIRFYSYNAERFSTTRILKIPLKIDADPFGAAKTCSLPGCEVAIRGRDKYGCSEVREPLNNKRNRFRSSNFAKFRRVLAAAAHRGSRCFPRRWGCVDAGVCSPGEKGASGLSPRLL